MIKKLALFLLVFYALSHFCQKQTDGFAVSKVSTLLLDGCENQDFPETTYHYLCKGGQSYVFISEDKGTILKLFRSSRLNTLKLFQIFLPHLKNKVDNLEEELRKTLQSYQIAEKHLKEQTGLIAVHLDHTPHSPIKIVDKLGIAHQLHNCPFVIQKRAVLVQDKIAQLMEGGQEKEAHDALTNLNGLIQHRIALGIDDGDPNLIKNFGFCDDRPIQIDGGRFSSKPLPCNNKLQSSKLELENWLEVHYPQLIGDHEKI